MKQEPVPVVPNYFDDMYSPEYAIDALIDLFVGLDRAGKLPVENKGIS